MLIDMPIHRRLLLSACLCLALPSILRAQTATPAIEVTPARVLADEPATIRVTGLQPHEHVALRAALTDGGNSPWMSQAEFVADDAGTIDTSKQAPNKGSYRIVSSMGLVWSMMPAAKDVHSYRAPRNEQTILFALMKDNKEVASAQLVQTFYPEFIHRVDLTGQLHGTLVVPDTPGPHPGVLVLGGSEGGMPVPKAIWLAAHGYAALALAYFRVPGLPQELRDIPLEYFGQAIGWMMQRPEIDPTRLAVMGGSRGGELALQLGSMYPELHAVVAYVPANVRYPSCCDRSFGPAWTWKGQPLAYGRPTSNSSAPTDMAAAIAVEQTHGPILMISGDDDGIWPSHPMTDAAVHRLQQAHFRYPVVHLDYPHAGHRAGNQWIIPTWSGGVTHPVSGQQENYGGNPEGNALSTLDATPKVLDFLKQSLAAAPPKAP
ncbi:MAG TPA: acyl-CoA thioester hydrolase/BAAT C-terminal domain-containing protein [Acidobacteriaceae bacterium]|jgi:dienelactone hydrolase